MNRLVQWLNLGGIVLLAGLCAAQWRQDGALHDQLHAGEVAAGQQRATIERQSKELEDQRGDLGEFRTRVNAADDAAREAGGKLAAAATQRSAAESERDQLQVACHGLQAALEQWKAAVAARDEALKKADALALQLAAERNAAVTKYNDLVGQYNAAAGELKKAGATIEGLAAQRNEAVARFNDLAAKYNALVAEHPAAGMNPH